MTMVVVRFRDGREAQLITCVTGVEVVGATLQVKTVDEDGRKTTWGYALVNVDWEERA